MKFIGHTKENLSIHDERTLAAAIGELHLLDSMSELQTYAIEAIDHLVGADITCWNEVSSLTILDAPVCTYAYRDIVHELMPLLSRFLSEHPVCTQFGFPPVLQEVLTVSELIDQISFEQLGLYREVYRFLDSRFQMVADIVPTTKRFIGITINRRLHDFSNRDRKIMELLRPHLKQVCLRMIQAETTADALLTLSRSLDNEQHGVFYVNHHLQITSHNQQAHAFVSNFKHHKSLSRFPPILSRWLQSLKHKSPAHMYRRRFSLANGELEFCAFVLSHGGFIVRCSMANPARKAEITPVETLSERETHVAEWLLAAKTNQEIATILGISRRTVEKHCRNIFTKLGVENRTAAVVELLGYH